MTLGLTPEGTYRYKTHNGERQVPRPTFSLAWGLAQKMTGTLHGLPGLPQSRAHVVRPRRDVRQQAGAVGKTAGPMGFPDLCGAWPRGVTAGPRPACARRPARRPRRPGGGKPAGMDRCRLRDHG